MAKINLTANKKVRELIFIQQYFKYLLKSNLVYYFAKYFL